MEMSTIPQGNQTYLQRPSSWGRATAGRQDVMSHVHTAKRKVYSLHSFSRHTDVGSRHLEY